MYNFSIDPNKWVDIIDFELIKNVPYWFKKENGQIIMGTPHSSNGASGIADVYAEDGCLRVNCNLFHIVKNGQVQNVLNK
jgi:hypothetical protein